MVETSDLGSTTGISSTGLLAASLLSIAANNMVPSVQLLEFNTVWLEIWIIFLYFYCC